MGEVCLRFNFLQLLRINIFQFHGFHFFLLIQHHLHQLYLLIFQGEHQLFKLGGDHLLGGYSLIISCIFRVLVKHMESEFISRGEILSGTKWAIV